MGGGVNRALWIPRALGAEASAARRILAERLRSVADTALAKTGGVQQKSKNKKLVFRPAAQQ